MREPQFPGVDPNLKDERVIHADLGVRGHHLDILSYDVSVFTINYMPTGSAPSSRRTRHRPIPYQYTTNIAKSRNWGVESLCPNLTFGNYLPAAGPGSGCPSFPTSPLLMPVMWTARNPPTRTKKWNSSPINHLAGRASISGRAGLPPPTNMPIRENNFPTPLIPSPLPITVSTAWCHPTM